MLFRGSLCHGAQNRCNRIETVSCDIGRSFAVFDHLLTLILQTGERAAAVFEFHLHMCLAFALHGELFQRLTARKAQSEHQTDSVDCLTCFEIERLRYRFDAQNRFAVRCAADAVRRAAADMKRKK